MVGSSVASAGSSEARFAVEARLSLSRESHLLVFVRAMELGLPSLAPLHEQNVRVLTPSMLRRCYKRTLTFLCRLCAGITSGFSCEADFGLLPPLRTNTPNCA